MTELSKYIQRAVGQRKAERRHIQSAGGVFSIAEEIPRSFLAMKDRCTQTRWGRREAKGEKRASTAFSILFREQVTQETSMHLLLLILQLRSDLIVVCSPIRYLARGETRLFIDFDSQILFFTRLLARPRSILHAWRPEILLVTLKNRPLPTATTKLLEIHGASRRFATTAITYVGGPAIMHLF